VKSGVKIEKLLGENKEPESPGTPASGNSKKKDKGGKRGKGAA